MGRRKKALIPPEKLAELWEEFKEKCDTKTAAKYDFSAKAAKFVSAEVPQPVSYTIEGFCVFAGIQRQFFYSNYDTNKKYSDIISHIREECEVNVRNNFEQGNIPTQLAPLWMSKFGYSSKPKEAEQEETPDDGFIAALKEGAKKAWQEE